jgi:hypothetical protein
MAPFIPGQESGNGPRVFFDGAGGMIVFLRMGALGIDEIDHRLFGAIDDNHVEDSSLEAPNRQVSSTPMVLFN